MNRVSLVLLIILIAATSAQSEENTQTREYNFVVNGTPAVGSWTVVRTTDDTGVNLSCSGIAQFRFVVPISYEFVADARYDRGGRLIHATSYINTVGLNHRMRIRAAGNSLEIEKQVRERKWRPIPAEGSQFTTMGFFNPDTVTRFFVPFREVEYHGIDLEQGTVRTLQFVVERIYSVRFARPVLRVMNESMELLYDQNTLELLSNKVTEMGITAELVIRE